MAVRTDLNIHALELWIFLIRVKIQVVRRDGQGSLQRESRRDQSAFRCERQRSYKKKYPTLSIKSIRKTRWKE